MSSPAGFPGNSTNQTALRDLVIFEERIRQNLGNLRLVREQLWRRFVKRLATLLVALLVSDRLLRLKSPEGYYAWALLLCVLSATLVVAGLTAYAGVTWRRAVDSRQYEEQCQKGLHPFHMQIRMFGPVRRQTLLSRLLYTSGFDSCEADEITFLRRLPRPLAAFLEAYRYEYRARRALRHQPKKTA